MKTESRNRDPFSRIPIPKSFYHPSQQKTLSKRQRKVALSPSKERWVSPEDELFLKGSNVFSTRTPPSRDQDPGPSRYDESWPSSERPSFNSISGHENSERLSDVKQSLHVFEQTDTIDDQYKTESVLQRYVNRFRNSAPMSREDRVRKGVGSEKEFWWLSNHPHSPENNSTPIDTSSNRSRQFIDRSESKAYDDTYKSLVNARQKRTQLEEALETKRLQEKADRILGQSESSTGSYDAGPAVSSEGLDSSIGQSSYSYDEPLHRSTHRKDYKHREFSDISKVYNQQLPPPVATINRPEDDILYQWRLQRKMDLSRNGAAELIAKNTSEVHSKIKEIHQKVSEKEMTPNYPSSSVGTVHFTPKPASLTTHNYLSEGQGHSRSEFEVVSTPGLSQQPTSSQKPVIASPTLPRKNIIPNQEQLEPHLHLMCDMLPCPHAKKYQEQYRDLYSDLENVDKTQYKQFLEAEKPHLEKNSRSQTAQTQTKTSLASVETSEWTDMQRETNTIETQTVSKSAESVIDSLDFDRSSSEDLVHHQGPSLKSSSGRSQLPKSPTRSTILRPKYAFSPATSKVGTAIGQAVKDFMFTPSSSLDSVSSLLAGLPDRQHEEEERQQEEEKQLNSQSQDDKKQFGRQLDTQPKGRTQQDRQPDDGIRDLNRKTKESRQGRQADNDRQVHMDRHKQEEEESEYISEGEYPDDQLLMLLRQQRAQIEAKLGDIEKLL